MNVKEIVIKYLKVNGFDGLCFPGECGCEIDDLIPCDSKIEECQPAHKIMFNDDECQRGCYACHEEEIGWCMKVKK